MVKAKDKKKIRPKFLSLFNLIISLPIMVAFTDVSTKTYIFISESLENYVYILMFATMLSAFMLDSLAHKSFLNKPRHYKLFKISEFLYSTKTQREIFEPVIADWQEEYFEALSKEEVWKARWINVRYTYAFLGAMWQKSPFGDLIEFISKIAK